MSDIILDICPHMANLHLILTISVFHENKPKLKKKLKQWNQKLNQKWLLKTEILPLHYHCL